MRTRTCPRFCIDAKGQLIYETCIDRHARIQRVEGIERELREKRRGKKKKEKNEKIGNEKLILLRFERIRKINDNTIERRLDRYFSRNLSKNSIYLVISSG